MAVSPGLRPATGSSRQGQDGLGHEGPGHFHPFLVAVGQHPHGPAGLVRQAEGVQGLQGHEFEPPLPVPQTRGPEEGLHQGGAGLDRQAAEDVVQDREARKDAEVLKGPGDTQPGHPVRRQPGNISALEPDGPGVGPDDPGEAVDEGGFAGAVGADKGGDLAPGRAKAHVGQGRQAPEVFGEPGNFKQVSVHENNPLASGQTEAPTR